MRSLTLIEHKKLLVRLFKRHLPGLKLSATSSRFTNGTSIHLTPKPGFLIGDPDIVRTLYLVCADTSYSRFDCMDDSTSCVRHTIQDPPASEPQVVMMGSTFVRFRDNRDGVPVVITEADIQAMLSDPEWPKVESGSVS